MTLSSPTDRIAREAARLFETGAAETIDAAIRRAIEALGLAGAPPPSSNRVRQHIQAMAMQAMGQPAYDARVRGVWKVAEELMTALDVAFPDAEPRLMGRAARGLADGDRRLFFRIHTRASSAEIAARLVEYGYDEPAFDTADTRFGRFDRVRVIDEGLELVITRCLPDMLWKAGVDLFHRRPVASADLEDLRARLAEPPAEA